MKGKERRNYIYKRLVNSNEPVKGSILGEEINVTRQVIVKDIAILRAEGENIIATPEGYMMISDNSFNVKRIIAVNHKCDRIEEELKTIISYGGVIEDVIVEHPLYGEIKGYMMIKSLYDLSNFMNKLYENKAEPLLNLTGGVHLHSIIAENDETMKKIINALKLKKFIIDDISDI